MYTNEALKCVMFMLSSFQDTRLYAYNHNSECIRYIVGMEETTKC